MHGGGRRRRVRGIARALLAFGCLSGLGIYLGTPFASPDQVMLASDVYQHAADRMLTGESFYGTAPEGRPGYFYLYPPLVTMLFVPHALLGSALAAYLLQTGLNLIAAVGTALVVARLLHRRGIVVTRLDRALIVAFFVLSSYSAIQFINGQVNLWLALAVAAGLDAIDRDRQRLAGIAFGTAALIKVFPAIMGLWLLRLRAWRAVTVAVVTGLVGMGVGVVVLGPDVTATYLTDVLLARFTGSTYEARPVASANVDGVHRQLAALWPGGIRWHTAIGLLVTGGLLVAALRRVETPRQRDVAALATITAVLLFLPVQPLYFPLLAVPLLLVVYDLPTGRSGWLFVVGTALTLIHLDRESVVLLLDMTTLPSGVDSAILASSEAVFRVVLPPTLGMWLLLCGCVAVQWGQPRGRETTAGVDWPDGRRGIDGSGSADRDND